MTPHRAVGRLRAVRGRGQQGSATQERELEKMRKGVGWMQLRAQLRRRCRPTLLQSAQRRSQTSPIMSVPSVYPSSSPLLSVSVQHPFYSHTGLCTHIVLPSIAHCAQANPGVLRQVMKLEAGSTISNL